MALYHDHDPKLSPQRFRDPGSEYRGTPFWAWNCKIDRQTLDEQIDIFQQMGMGGYHCHVRTGMATPYLSDAFMADVRHCAEYGREKGMLTWLYDEDRWPSGTAGGKVTKGHPEYVNMNLLWTPRAYGTAGPVKDMGVFATGRGGNREENGELLAAFDVVLDENGCLKRYERIAPDAPAQGVKWYAYPERAVPSAWFNDQPYIDVLSKEAVERFVSITHERYRETMGDLFGTDIPAIFTDEPSFADKGTLGFANSREDVFLPWTARLEEHYQRRYGDSLVDHLPQLFWDLPDGQVSLVRYRFHDLVTELFASCYVDTLGDWCRQNRLMLSGHMLDEETLESQTRVIGEAMRCYRAFDDMPGIDMLCDFHQYNTAKQAQSAKHQHGNQAMLSELYGVTSWHYTFRDYKLQGDWQAALGVTVRVPHLTWMSMKGEAKRDYPASIGYQSPWCGQFRLVEDHFARLNTAMTRGRPVVKVAVVHPIESYWLYWGPKEQTAARREQLESRFSGLTETLLFGGIDFDFLCESRLEELCPKAGSPLQVGQMAYDHVIVPGLKTLRRTTLERLKAFREAGGDLLFLGECPDHVDALPCADAQALYAASRHSSFEPCEVLEKLECARTVDLRTADGARTTDLLYQLREDGDGRWLFVAKGKNPVCHDVDEVQRIRIRIPGLWKPVCYDTLTGDILTLPAEYVQGMTQIWRDWHIHDSCLLWLEPGCAQAAPEEAQIETALSVAVPPLAEFVTDEPNVLLLDQAEWRLDEGDWQPRMELLRIDNACRDAAGIPRRAKHVLQPYLLQPEACTHEVQLRFVIPCSCAVSGAHLALEDAQDTRIHVNGLLIPSAADGWYVDHAIHTVPLPDLPAGDNVIELCMPIGRRTNLEWCYLLGDFGVQVYGSQACIIPRPARIGYGSIVHQGFPFYTGNLRYRFSVTAGGVLRIRVPKFRAALLRVTVDGCDMGPIMTAPYQVETPVLPQGLHTVEIIAYGMRQNGFGQVHHENGVYYYQDPNSWRSTGDLWLDEYQLFPLGVLKAPEIMTSSTKENER